MFVSNTIFKIKMSSSWRQLGAVHPTGVSIGLVRDAVAAADEVTASAANDASPLGRYELLTDLQVLGLMILFWSQHL